jgi:hypothetical protein
LCLHLREYHASAHRVRRRNAHDVQEPLPARPGGQGACPGTMTQRARPLRNADDARTRPAPPKQMPPARRSQATTAATVASHSTSPQDPRATSLGGIPQPTMPHKGSPGPAPAAGSAPPPPRPLPLTPRTVPRSTSRTELAAEGTGEELARTSDGHPPTARAGWPHRKRRHRHNKPAAGGRGMASVDRLAGSSRRSGAANGGAGCRVLPTFHRPRPTMGYRAHRTGTWPSLEGGPPLLHVSLAEGVDRSDRPGRARREWLPAWLPPSERADVVEA